MCRFWVRWRDAVQGALSAVWLATQARSNAAMRPQGLPKMGYWLFPPPLFVKRGAPRLDGRNLLQGGQKCGVRQRSQSLDARANQLAFLDGAS